jgi:hypothetical protein
VRGQVHPVDGEQRPGVVHEPCDLLDRRPRADQVRGAGDGDQPGAGGQHLRDVVGGELAGGRVERRPAHRRTYRLGGEHPRTDVRVVVQPGDHHLVARAPARRQGAGQVEGELGGAAPEDDAPRVRTQQIGDRRTSPEDDVVRQSLGSRSAAAVGDR